VREGHEAQAAEAADFTQAAAGDDDDYIRHDDDNDNEVDHAAAPAPPAERTGELHTTAGVG
jgi:hypothetical protein